MRLPIRVMQVLIRSWGWLACRRARAIARSLSRFSEPLMMGSLDPGLLADLAQLNEFERFAAEAFGQTHLGNLSYCEHFLRRVLPKAAAGGNGQAVVFSGLWI